MLAAMIATAIVTTITSAGVHTRRGRRTTVVAVREPTSAIGASGWADMRDSGGASALGGGGAALG